MTLDLDTLMRQMTEQKAKDALLTARSTLERSLRELDHYIERLDTAESPQGQIPGDELGAQRPGLQHHTQPAPGSDCQRPG
jgi:hypothetical protein